ncbi:MAG: hypothetical protein LBD70_04045 [Bifidobacteriaceae bacterium]|jgi:hypothetical protein|nr:hypothetical protein [Bifidobacteriaceae bacterium]
MDSSPERQQWIEQVNLAVAGDRGEGVRLGATSLNQRVLDAIREPQGVNAELLLVTLGALAGFTVQQTLRHLAPGGPLRPGGPEERAAFVVLETADGRRYYHGDPLNRLLFELPESVLGRLWGLAAAAGLGLDRPPDLDELAGHVASTLGLASFGMIRLRTFDEPPLASVETLVRHFWPEWSPDLAVFCPSPEDWLALAAASLVDGLAMARDAVPAADGLRIAMEAALAASKLDPAAL